MQFSQSWSSKNLEHRYPSQHDSGFMSQSMHALQSSSSNNRHQDISSSSHLSNSNYNFTPNSIVQPNHANSTFLSNSTIPNMTCVSSSTNLSITSGNSSYHNSIYDKQNLNTAQSNMIQSNITKLPYINSHPTNNSNSTSVHNSNELSNTHSNIHINNTNTQSNYTPHNINHTINSSSKILSTIKEGKDEKNIIDQRLRRKKAPQIISDFKNSLVTYVENIENALGASQMGVKVNSSIAHQPDLTENQKESKDQLFMAFELMSHKLKQLDEENSSLRFQLNGSQINWPQINNSQSNDSQINYACKSNEIQNSSSTSPSSDEEDIQFDDVLISCQDAFEERKKKLEIIEMRLKYITMRNEKIQKDQLDSMNLPENIKNIAFDPEYLQCLENVRTIKAPTENVTLIFIDIRGSTALWEACGNAMFEAILQYHSITRKLQQKYQLYECKSNGDGFFLATQDVKNAILFCLELQIELLNTNWSEKILETEGAKPIYSNDGRLLFKGLTIRCGCHFSSNPMCIVDPVTGRTDYVGTDVNKAARLETAALEGELAISDDLFKMIEQDLKNQNFSMKIYSRDRGMRKLKGIDQEERVRGLLPSLLESRFDYNDEKELNGHDNDLPSTLESLEIEQKKLQDEMNNLQNETLEQIQLASQKKIKMFERRFIQDLQQLTTNSQSVNVQQIMQTIQKYQNSVSQQESHCENYCTKVREMNIIEKNSENNTQKSKKLKKKKFKKQQSFSQLTADIHKSTISSVTKVKQDKSLNEIENLKAKLQHAKNEVAILRRARKIQPTSPQKGVTFAYNGGTSPNSYPVSPHSPTSSIPIPNSSNANSISTSPFASPTTPMSNVMFGLSSPRIPVRFENKLKARSLVNNPTFINNSDFVDLPVALQSELSPGFGIRQGRGRSNTVASPLPIKDPKTLFAT